MFNKKALLLSTAFMCANMTCAFAQGGAEITGIFFNGNKITFETQSSQQSNIRILVSRADAEEKADNVYWISEKDTADNTKSTFSFIMPDLKNGEDTTADYKIQVKTDGSDVSERRFRFVSSTLRADTLAVINNMNAEDNTDDFIKLFEDGTDRDAFVTMGLPVELFDNLSRQGKEKAAACFLAEKTGEIDEAEAGRLFLQSAGIEALNEAEQNKVSDILSLLNPNAGTSDYSSASEDLKTWICTMVYRQKTYADKEALQKTVDNANILYMFNHARYHEIERLLADNAETIGINTASYYKTYCAMSLANKTAVNEKFVSLSAGSASESFEKLREKLKTAVESVQDKGGSTGGGSGSGNGGSGNTAGSKSSNIGSVVMPQNGAESVRYDDISEAVWAADAIEALSRVGIVSGTGDRKFEPQRHVTREEFVKMIVSAAGITDDKIELRFSDVKADDWFAVYVKRAVKAGIISGESEERFGSGKPLTRQDMVVIALRACKRNFEEGGSQIEFADEAQISDYAHESVRKACSIGVVSGFDDNTFRPLERCTRAMAAQVIYNMFIR